MDVYQGSFISAADMEEQAEMTDVKKGPWTAEEDAMLMNYVTIHGEGRWNSVARFAGLKRTGKSCRLRWLNYLRPDLRRGNMTLQEQLLILELHSRWGNRWSKIAQYMPGRTDNEIKNYWRTRVQKQAKQLKCDVNSKQFRDAMQYVWMPRLREQIQSSTSNTSSFSQPAAITNPDAVTMANQAYNHQAVQTSQPGYEIFEHSGFMPEMSACTSDDSSLTHVTPVSDRSECYDCQWSETRSDNGSASCTESFVGNLGSGFPVQEQNECNPWVGGGGDGDNLMMMVDNWWNEENIFFLQQQLSDDCF